MAPLQEALWQADQAYLTQYRHRRWNPRQRVSNNANCGPASVAMALRALGRLPSEVPSGEPAALIAYVREAMTGTRREGTWTYPIQIVQAAPQLGLHAEFIFGIEAIRRAMREPDHLVVLNLNPTPAYVDKITKRYSGGHFALLNAVNDTHAVLSDPLASEPIVITMAQLAQAIGTPLGHWPNGREIPPFNGGVLLWPRESAP
ncbi:MAG: C39 family peptidase [Candidatus Sericytochromatia bacterium]|nr:C39 family peptidase [Candidatus Sericytochromatia bacterium]